MELPQGIPGGVKVKGLNPFAPILLQATSQVPLEEKITAGPHSRCIAIGRQHDNRTFAIYYQEFPPASPESSRQAAGSYCTLTAGLFY